MILTFKAKHELDFSEQLHKAKQIAKYAIINKNKLSSANVSHFSLKSAISNQILRKYGRNKNIKKVSKVKLIVPGQSIKLNLKESTITIPCLKVSFRYQFKHSFSKVNQIEINNKYFYVSVSVIEKPQVEPKDWIGIDRNTNGHCVVSACPLTNKVMMLGKKAKHIHTKYSKIRKKLQREKKYRKLVSINKRESNIVKDLNHKISSKVVKHAEQHSCGIRLEDLGNIRKTTKQAKSFRYTLNSWSYYQLQTLLEYKAKLHGVKIAYVEPAYTSQTCHKCGHIGRRNGKVFKCQQPGGCGYTAHADVNASWNIAMWQLLAEPKSEYSAGSDSLSNNSVYSQRSMQEGDCIEGSTDTPQWATTQNTVDPKTRTPVALA